MITDPLAAIDALADEIEFTDGDRAKVTTLLDKGDQVGAADALADLISEAMGGDD